MLHSTALDDLGLRHGTDKSSGPKGHDFLRKYEFFLAPLRDADFTFLELGVFMGASLRVFGEYFSRAKIVGVDNNPQVGSFDVGRAEVVIGDLADHDFLTTLAALGAKVVLDDASHWWPDQLRALGVLYPSLGPGSVYILEDVHTSFEPLAPHFSVGARYSPFYLVTKIAEYMTGNDRPSPVIPGKNLVPLKRDESLDSEIRALADLTDAVVFIERACVLIRK
ncbi:MAG: class I SAM-dependent methyltransferase [Deltaproteobacteria bacterium]|jgi:SAM-dependent methyltransferase|nr:class I SAM-dependent methyltransferase [Deltaproteobacteria bacterium]